VPDARHYTRGSRGSPESVFVQEQPEAEQHNLLVAQSLTGSGQKICALLSSVETTGLNSSDVPATLFDLEMKGFVWQLPGKQFSKILL